MNARFLLTGLLAFGCAGDDSQNAIPQRRAIVLTGSTDAASGAFSIVDLDTLAVTKQVGPAGGDAVGRAWFDRYYVVKRFQSDSVLVFDAENGYQLQKEFSCGDTTANCQDICCVAANKCYVPRLQAPDLWIVDPTAEEEKIGSVDLAPLSEDGNPNASACAIFGDNLLVELQNLPEEDWYPAMPPGWTAVIDTTTDEVVSRQETCAHNPFGPFAPEPGGATALVPCIGDFGALDGGFCRIDVETGTCLGTAVTEEALQTEASRIAVCSTGEGWAITGGLDTRLVAVDVDAGTVGKTLFDPGGYFLTFIAVDDRDRLWVADRRVDGTTGIRIWTCDGMPLTKQPLDLGLPPAFEGVIAFQ